MKPIRWYVAVVGLTACGALAPANVAGNYTISLTKRANGCNIMPWTMGEMTSAVPMTITQNNSAITGMVTGGSGAVLDVILGSHTFTGAAAGTSFVMSLHGTTQGHSGNCAYTYTATVNGVLSGDVVTGTLDLTPETNKGTDCATLEGCKTTQDFNGTRPPT